MKIIEDGSDRLLYRGDIRDALKVIDKKYDVIYADPPWDFVPRGDKEPHRTNASNHYNVLSTQEIIDLPVQQIASDDSILFLWTTDIRLDVAFQVIEGWGFTYKTMGFVWVKTTKHGSKHWGNGYWTRSNPEYCLLATRGSPKKARNDIHSVIHDTVKDHSRKPNLVRTQIQKLMESEKRIELFARQVGPGWDAIGDQVNPMKNKKKFFEL